MTPEDEFYEAHTCPSCGYWCDDDECECPDSCMVAAALADSVPFAPATEVSQS